MIMPFTQTQEAVLKQAYDLLGEHFDHALLVVCSEVETETSRSEATNVLWSGGYIAALGMAEYARHQINGKPSDDCEP